MATPVTLRQARLLTLQGLAARSGCAYRTVFTAEHGQTVPEFTAIKKLSAALGVEPGEIVDFRRAMALQCLTHRGVPAADGL